MILLYRIDRPSCLFVSMNVLQEISPIMPPSNSSKPANVHLDLFKYYIDLVVRVNVLYFSVVGALVTYLTTNINLTTNIDRPLNSEPTTDIALKGIGFLLLLPYSLSLIQVVGFFQARGLAWRLYSKKVAYCFPRESKQWSINNQYPFNPLLKVMELFSFVHFIIMAVIFYAFNQFEEIQFDNWHVFVIAVPILAIVVLPLCQNLTSTRKG